MIANHAVANYHVEIDHDKSTLASWRVTNVQDVKSLHQAKN